MKREGSTEIMDGEALYDANLFSVQQLTTRVKMLQKFVRISTGGERNQTETTAYARIDVAAIILSSIIRAHYENKKHESKQQK